MKKTVILLLVMLHITELSTYLDTSTLRSFLASIATRSVIPIKNNDDLKQQILNNQGCAVVKFYAPWCSACTSTKKFYINLAQTYTTVAFYQINISSTYGKQLIKQFSLRSLPTFVFFKNGKKVTFQDEQGKTVDRIVGTANRELLEKQIQLLATA